MAFSSSVLACHRGDRLGDPRGGCRWPTSWPRPRRPTGSGLTNPEIAARLFLSNHTVKTHISRIFAKTGSRDRVAAIGYARRHDIG